MAMKTNKKIYLLLVVFFIVYIGTGSVFALLGSAWPAISADIAAPVSWQSILIVIIYSAGALGAATTQHVIARFGNWAPVAFVLLVLTTIVFLFSSLRNFSLMPVICVFLGYFFTMSSTTINGYAAKNYSPMLMSWLHCFFSLGSMISPVILSYFILNKDSWRMGYQATGILTGSILAVVLVSFPVWRAHGYPLFPNRKPDSAAANGAAPAAKAKSIRELMRLPGVAIMPVAMYFYCSVEVTIFFWAATYLTEAKGFAPGTAASLVAIVYGSQVAGRVAGGFATLKFSSRAVVRTGMAILIVSSVAFAFSPAALLKPSLALLGFSLGPNYPLILSETPSLVGPGNSQGVIGLQMTAANIASVTMPALLGAVASYAGFGVFPVFMVALACAAFALKTIQNRTFGKIAGKGEA